MSQDKEGQEEVEILAKKLAWLIEGRFDQNWVEQMKQPARKLLEEYTRHPHREGKQVKDLDGFPEQMSHSKPCKDGLSRMGCICGAYYHNRSISIIGELPLSEAHPTPKGSLHNNTCPYGGCKLKVVSSDEGTSHYEVEGKGELRPLDKEKFIKHLNSLATFEIENVPYINLTPQLKNSPDNLIWLTQSVEDFLFNLYQAFGRPAVIEIEEIAADVLYHIESMYPEVYKTMSKSCRLSVRNTIINKLKGALAERDK